MKFRETWPRDDAQTQLGDDRFVGMATNPSPEKLPAGYVALARNMRFIDGKAVTRPGIAKMAWSNSSGIRWPASWPLEWDKIAPFPDPAGVGVYMDSTFTEWGVVATRTKVFRFREGVQIIEVPMPAGEIPGDRVLFVQAMGSLHMFRGPDKAPLIAYDLVKGFEAVEKTDNEVSGTGSENPKDGTEAIPAASLAAYYSNRLWIISGDGVMVSDYLNTTRYAPMRSQFRVGEGADDRLVALTPMAPNGFLFFKSATIYALTGAMGDLSSATLDIFTAEYGCAAARTIALCGNDIWFLSDRGVVSIRKTEMDKSQGQALPVSAPILGLIKRINWECASDATAAYWDNKYYLAVPLDGSSQNNAVLIYDFVNQAWSGYDDGPSAGVYAWIRLTIAGRKRLMSIDYEGFVNLWEEGWHDDAQYRHQSGTELTIIGTPIHGSTIRINGGTIVTVDTSSTTNGVSSWGAFNDGHRLERLASGWSSGLWTAPDCTTEAVIDGVRFTSTVTDGDYAMAPPQVVFNIGSMVSPPAWAWIETYYGIASVPIASELVTRGYLRTDYSHWTEARLQLETWNPNVTISVIRDGVWQDQTIKTNWKRSRTKYFRPFNAMPWVATNANGDHGNPGREDYSVTIPNAGFNGEGVALDLMQSWEIPFRLSSRGVFSQLRIVNETGKIKLGMATAMAGSQMLSEETK